MRQEDGVAQQNYVPFAGRLGAAVAGGGFAQADHWTWCGSVARGADGRYHMFASRWPRTLPFFDGYKVASEVVRAESDTPEGPYTFAEVVLPDRGADAWDGRMTHNPTIIHWAGAWRLFYIGATYPGPRPDGDTLRAAATDLPSRAYSTIRIGMASAPDLCGPWTRPERPCLDVRPGAWDASVVTNPAPCLDPEGGLWLGYRSNMVTRGARLGMARAETPDAPFERAVEGPLLPDIEGNMEDAFIWHNGRAYELVAKDIEGAITGDVGAGLHAWSRDARSWSLCTPCKAWSRALRWSDGTAGRQGSFERPQLLLEHGVPRWLFAATADGPGGFRNADRTWTLAMPLDAPGGAD